MSIKELITQPFRVISLKVYLHHQPNCGFQSDNCISIRKKQGNLLIISSSELMSIDTVEQSTMLDRCLDGDRNSQKWLYEKHYGKMLAVCLRYSSDMDQAKDMLQEGFIKVFNSLDKFNRKGSLEGWIRRIMVNTAIDHIRKDKRSLTLSHSEELLDKGLEVVEETEIDDNESLQLNMSHVIEAMQELSPGYKAVFNLYVMEDMTHKEIAETLGISEGTSKSNLAKAKMNLRKILLDNNAH